MISCFDASILIFLFDAKANAPLDPTTGNPVAHCQERVRHLLNKHATARGSRIVVPTPAMAEFLVRTDSAAAGEYMSPLQRLKGVKIAAFAERAAIEFADIQRSSMRADNRREGRDLETRAKAKFDQQIVAIARAEGATTLYTDDKGLAAYARRVDIQSVGIAALELSPDSRQGSLPLGPMEPAPIPEKNVS